MNTHELEEAERSELQAIREKMTLGDWEAGFKEQRAVLEKYRILRQEANLIRDWGFPAEEWASLSKEAKIVILDMVAEADRYERLREDLYGWLEQAP